MPRNDRKGEARKRRVGVLSGAYLLASWMLAAGAFLYTTNDSFAFYALVLLNLPLSAPGYFVILVVAFLFSNSQGNLGPLARLGCFSFWALIPIVQLLSARVIWRQAKSRKLSP
jgi:hypothetical protein